jgi:hypothetical protein
VIDALVGVGAFRRRLPGTRAGLRHTRCLRLPTTRARPPRGTAPLSSP